MSETPPSVTVIIAARPDQAEVIALNAARQFDYPAGLLEIIVARGRQPSVQRNAAVKTARGEWIYFLDDDSVPLRDNLRRALAHLSDPAVKMVGGPNLCPPDAPPLEQVFATVLASWVAFGPSRARYTPVGEARPAGEKELILCNLMAHRAAMLDLGGFNEALYPNEENALMDELRKRGGKLIYDPQFIVHRRPRRSLKSFAKMLMTYGRGRAEQFRVYPTFGSALNFVPPLFCVYLLALPIIESITWVPGSPGSHFRDWSAAPLSIFAVAIVLQTFVSMVSFGVVRSLLALPLLAVTPVLYGLGFCRGLFTSLKLTGERPPVDVKLETIAR